MVRLFSVRLLLAILFCLYFAGSLQLTTAQAVKFGRVANLRRVGHRKRSKALGSLGSGILLYGVLKALRHYRSSPSWPKPSAPIVGKKSESSSARGQSQSDEGSKYLGKLKANTDWLKSPESGRGYGPYSTGATEHLTFASKHLLTPSKSLEPRYDSRTLEGETSKKGVDLHYSKLVAPHARKRLNHGKGSQTPAKDRGLLLSMALEANLPVYSRSSKKDIVEKMSLILISTMGDGSCQYRAICKGWMQVSPYKSENECVAVLRGLVGSALADPLKVSDDILLASFWANDYFETFGVSATEKFDPELLRQIYVDQVTNRNAWGDELTLTLLAKELDILIRLNIAGASKPKVIGDRETAKYIVAAHFGHDHYSALEWALGHTRLKALKL